MTTLAFDRRKLVPLVLLILAAAASGGWWWTHRKPANGPLVLQGNVEVRQVNLAFKVAGRIKKLIVDEGDTVTEGQPLATLDKIYFEERLRKSARSSISPRPTIAKMKAGNRPEEIAQAKSLVAEREATRTNAQITKNRAEALLKSPAGSQKAFDDSIGRRASGPSRAELGARSAAAAGDRFPHRDIALAKAQFDERKADLQTAERQLTDADLIAPSDGSVLSRVREAGAIVQAGETAFVLSLTSPVWVRTYVSEPDLGRISPGWR